MGAQVSLSLEEYDEMRARLRASHEENGRLEAELRAAQSADPEGRVVKLTEAVRAALPIIRFGVSNLDPRAVTRWPYEALRAFADALEHAPLGPDMRECAIELRAFAREAEQIELERQDRGLYDGPDPIDLGLLREIAQGAFTRVGALVDAGYLTVALTEEGREAVEELRADAVKPAAVAVASE